MEPVDRLEHRLLFGYLYQLLAGLAAGLDLFVPEAVGSRSADGVAA